MPTDPQDVFTDDQDIFNINIDDYFANFILPIDQIRSTTSATNPGAATTNSQEAQESRLSAFYRMIGFPVVLSDGSDFYSPGFDPNLNTDVNSYQSVIKIAQTIFTDNVFISKQLNPRESKFLTYKAVWNNGGANAQAVMLGSLFIRSFDKQFNDAVTDPLTPGDNGLQIVNTREAEINRFFASRIAQIDTSLLITTHQLKPFIVDPRIDLTVTPAKNRICAPFLLDRSQTRIFQPQSGAPVGLQRPYIEEVIGVRFNSRNKLKNADLVNSTVAFIKNNSTITDSQLIAISQNALSALYSSELAIFNNYFKAIRALVDLLHDSISNVESIRQIINFQPIPDPVRGPENGGTLPSIDPTDDQNNLDPEIDIIKQTAKKDLTGSTFDTGLQGIPDPGDFVFSNLDDTVFNVTTTVTKSYDDTINKLSDKRDQLGNGGIDSLKTIEIIMGEFSGLGLIDIVAIQASLWVMDSDSLLGLIDSRARTRITNRPDIDISAASPAAIADALTSFEGTLKNIYIFIQQYLNDLETGSAKKS
jgi:hypothetical protein